MADCAIGHDDMAAASHGEAVVEANAEEESDVAEASAALEGSAGAVDYGDEAEEHELAPRGPAET